jgi:hypothetical protein
MEELMKQEKIRVFYEIARKPGITKAELTYSLRSAMKAKKIRQLVRSLSVDGFVDLIQPVSAAKGVKATKHYPTEKGWEEVAELVSQGYMEEPK